MLPPDGENWSNHTFRWQRKTSSGWDDLTYTKSTFTDNNPPVDEELQYRVIVKHEACDTEYILDSNPFFYFESVPTSFTVDNINNTGRIKQRETSCEAATDGQIIIEGRTNEADRTYFYNIALKNGDDIETTTILSSSAKKGSERVIFPDGARYPVGETTLSEEDWREAIGVSTGTYVVQVINGEKVYNKTDETFENVGYCFKEFEITVDPEPELSIDDFFVEKEISCHVGNNGEMKVKFSGGRAPYTLQLLEKEGEVFKANGDAVSTDETNHTFENLPTGHYKVRITLSDGVCWKETENSVYLDQPAALSLADENVTRSTDDATYHDAWITCPGADDAYLEVSPQGGNLARNYTATLYKDDVEQTSETFTEAHRFANLSPGQYKIIVEDVCATNAPVSSKTFDIYEPLPLIIDSVRTAPITCYGVPNGQITMSSREGTGTRQFKIDDGDWDRMKLMKAKNFRFPT